ncbi:hypothetical protein [uncultured Campylobacter sp.]|uniref:hypothetical protein n=1 Tax=uncultured Campylobacter sp. TaxID=218934 RepID=UPI002620237F|nr:hypothetical protein [uncultured Campylobacter sp.]
MHGLRKFTLMRVFRLDLALYARDQIRKILLRDNTARTSMRSRKTRLARLAHRLLNGALKFYAVLTKAL